MAEKDYNINIGAKNVVHTNISRYKDGYNYASMGIKMADDEFMSVSYEWKGKHVPEFALNVMDIMKSGGEQASLADLESIERASQILAEVAAKMKKENPFSKKKDDEEDMEDDDKKSKDKDNKSKDKSKKKKDC